MGGFYLHAFKITAGLGYLVFKLNQESQQTSELIRLQVSKFKFISSVSIASFFKMQIKFCDNLCSIHQGPILRPIPSISGIEQSLSKLAGDTRLSSAARGKGWLRGTMRMQQCALGSLQGQGPAPGWGKAQNQGRLGDE